MMLNRKQRTTITVAAVVVGLMLMFPPHKGAVYGESQGYWFLFGTSRWANANKVDVGTLGAQWVAVLVIAGAVVLVQGDH